MDLRDWLLTKIYIVLSKAMVTITWEAMMCCYGQLYFPVEIVVIMETKQFTGFLRDGIV